MSLEKFVANGTAAQAAVDKIIRESHTPELDQVFVVTVTRQAGRVRVGFDRDADFFKDQIEAFTRSLFETYTAGTPLNVKVF